MGVFTCLPVFRSPPFPLRKRSTKIKFHVPEQGFPSSQPAQRTFPETGIIHGPTTHPNFTKNRKEGMPNTHEQPSPRPESWTLRIVEIRVFEDQDSGLMVAQGTVHRHPSRFTAGRSFQVVERIYQLMALATQERPFISHPAFAAHPTAVAAIAAWLEYERDTATL